MNRDKFRAVVFDMDGVLADSEPVYFAAINGVLAQHGRSIDEKQHASVMASSPEESVKGVLRMADLDLPVAEFMAAYDGDLLERLPKLSRPLPGVVEAIDRLGQMKVPTGLASSSEPAWIEAILAGLGLSDAFDAIVSGSMVASPKPAPDIYLLAAQRLAVGPGECIAIEDTPTGLASANAAGMYTIQVRSSSTAFPPQQQADLVLESLEGFDVEMVSISDK